MNIKTSYSLFVFFLVASTTTFCTHAQANEDKQADLSAPIYDFELPLFAEDGYKRWQLSGHEGRYLGNSRILVLLMHVQVFHEKKLNKTLLNLKSPEASIDLSTKQAKSPYALDIEGKGFHIHGKNWVWSGPQKKIILQKEVKTTFDQALSSTLF